VEPAVPTRLTPSESGERPNKGMEQTNGALAGMKAPFAAHPRCSADCVRARPRVDAGLT
jgi:hypothetical protein